MFSETASPIFIDYNMNTVLHSEYFAKNDEVKYIYLNCKNLHMLYPRNFYKLSNVKVIYLELPKLNTISYYTFRKMSSLVSLTINIDT